MKWELLLVLISISSGYPMITGESSAVSEPTTINVACSKIEAQINDIIVFYISIKNNRSNFVTGEVQITDETTGRQQSYSLEQDILSCSWQILATDSVGWHQFTFIGPFHENYENSQTFLKILIEQSWISSTGYYITLSELSGLDGKQVQFDTNITAQIELKSLVYTYYRRKAYITISDNATGIILGTKIYEEANTPIIAKKDYLNFSFILPRCLSSGLHSLRIFYSGSESLNHLNSELQFSVNLVDSDYLINISPEFFNLSRGTDVQHVMVDITGYHVSQGELILTAYNNFGFSQLIYSNTAQTSQEVSFPVDATFPIGNVAITAQLLINNIVVADSSANMIIYDEIYTNIQANKTICCKNENVMFSGWLSEQDLLTSPVEAVVDIYAEQSLLTSQNSTKNGFFSYLWHIPDSWITGSTNITFIVPDTGYFYGTTISLTITVLSEISLDWVLPKLDYLRGETLAMELSIQDIYTPLNDVSGQISLKLTNGTVLAEKSYTPLDNIISWTIPTSFPVGLTPLQLLFQNAGHYVAKTVYSQIRVISQPEFVINLSETINICPTANISITNIYLQDECAQGLDNQVVELWDSSQRLASTYSTESGLLIFTFTVPSTYTDYRGYKLWYLRYTGNDSAEYLPINTITTLEVIVNPIMSLLIENSSLIATKSTAINIAGRIFGEMVLEWRIIANNDWQMITSFTTSSAGTYSYMWTVPDVIGPIQLRLRDSLTDEWFIKEIIVYKEPTISIIFPSAPYLWQSSLDFDINSDSKFRVLVNGEIYSSWIIAGTYHYTLPLTTLGVLTIEVEIQDDYTRSVSQKYLFQVVAQTSIHINAPTIVDELEFFPIVIELTAYGTPVTNQPITLIDQKTQEIITSFQTDETGKVVTTIALTSIGQYTLELCYLGDNLYLPSNVSFPLTIRAVTTINCVDTLVTMTEEELQIPFSLTTSHSLPIFTTAITIQISNDSRFWTVLGTSSTNDSGIGNFTWIVLHKPGYYWLNVSYSGDSGIKESNKVISLWIKPGNGPRLIQYSANYTIDTVSREVTFELTVELESNVDISSVTSILDTGSIKKEYPMNYNSELHHWVISISVTVAKYSWSIRVIDSLGVIATYFIEDLCIDQGSTLTDPIKPTIPSSMSITAKSTDLVSYSLLTVTIAMFAAFSLMIRRYILSPSKR